MNTHLKTKQIKLLREVRELNYLPSQVQIPQPGALFLMRLRARVGQPRPVITPLTINVTFKKDNENHAQTVNITHL